MRVVGVLRQRGTTFWMLFVLTTLRGCVHRAVSAKTKLNLGRFKMDRVEMMNCVLITERLNVPFSYPGFDAELWDKAALQVLQ